MPSLTKEQLDAILKLETKYNNIKCFVETGTYLGDTILNMQKYFDELHTIELSEYYFNKIKNKSKKINFHLGDSGKILGNILKQINKPTIFFLDGHWSSGITAKGEKECPVIEELQFINKLHNYDSVIIIDDKRLFGTNINENWSDITISNILNQLDNIKSFYEVDDRFVIFLKQV